ncbi:delta-1-pyrroline-5-carboxylate synthase-like isoform X2 [Artemia franciscana]
MKNRQDEQPKAFHQRSDLKRAKRVVIKLGSAVITREDECGLALGRLASIVEQVAELQNEGRECIMVTSGAVAFGKQKLVQELIMSMSMRDTLSSRDSSNKSSKTIIEPRAAAAIGQTGLMSLYEAMFAQYSVKVAQVLVTKPDFYNEETRNNLRSTIQELISLNIVPIINTNDAVSPPPQVDEDLTGIISIKDNDSLAARLAVEIESELLILMSDVDGIYTCPPSQEGAKLISVYTPGKTASIQYGQKSRVGLGGMDSKARAACWALDKGISVVICNGTADFAVRNIVQGKRLGTFFTEWSNNGLTPEAMAQKARQGGRILFMLNGEERSDIVRSLADNLISRADFILEANRADLSLAKRTKLAGPLSSRLALTPAKLKSLSDGIKQISETCKSIVYRPLRHTRLASGLDLTQITVPIGVLMVIFESRPDCLPQVAALSIASANGILLKGGKEAKFSNEALMDVVKDSLSAYKAEEAVNLVSTREEVSDLLQLEEYIDLVIPRGSSELVSSIQKQSNIPVLGHAEGICHVYLDAEADMAKAIKIIRDSKCDYPAACNSMETLLIHQDLADNQSFFKDIIDMLRSENVKINAGPSLSRRLTFGPPPAKSFKLEYSGLECTVEVVNSLKDAILHINRYGSGHTDAIVTENKQVANEFLRSVCSACVFHNASTRFADGFRFGLGAEVGISTARIHARGPVGIEGLLTTKWVLKGQGQAVTDFGPGKEAFTHETLSLSTEVFDTTNTPINCN